MDGVLDLVPSAVETDAELAAWVEERLAARKAARAARDFAAADAIRASWWRAACRSRTAAGTTWRVARAGCGRQPRRADLILPTIPDTVALPDLPGRRVDRQVEARRVAGMLSCADVAQLAEHLICNQAVTGSIPVVSFPGGSARATCGGVLKWPTRSDCKSDGASLRRFESFPHHRMVVGVAAGHGVQDVCGSSSVGRALAFQA
jgi:hypothetical protein